MLEHQSAAERQPYRMIARQPLRPSARRWSQTGASNVLPTTDDASAMIRPEAGWSTRPSERGQVDCRSAAVAVRGAHTAADGLGPVCRPSAVGVGSAPPIAAVVATYLDSSMPASVSSAAFRSEGPALTRRSARASSRWTKPFVGTDASAWVATGQVSRSCRSRLRSPPRSAPIG
jgi:hypothetical protein